MTFELAPALEILERTPSALDRLLRGLSPGWLDADEGAATWSPRVVLGHLIHGEETDWIPRARIILANGETRPFDPYDRFAQMARPKAATLDAELDLFAAARARSLADLTALELSAADLARRGTHPQLGTVTLGNLLSCWAAHDLVHMRQIARVLCRQHEDEVGPWRAYLPPLASAMP
jgi:hypothetical protein